MDITQASKEIAAILESLEIDQKALVLDLAVRDTDITKPIDAISQKKREVIIVLDIVPGSNWAK